MTILIESNKARELRQLGVKLLHFLSPFTLMSLIRFAISTQSEGANFSRKTGSLDFKNNLPLNPLFW